ncbi:hypothetical protein Tco_1285183 [Tanacetum coccineum]
MTALSRNIVSFQVDAKYEHVGPKHKKTCLAQVESATVAQAAHAAQAATATHSPRGQRPSLLRVAMDASVDQAASVILATAKHDMEL